MRIFCATPYTDFGFIDFGIDARNNFKMDRGPKSAVWVDKEGVVHYDGDALHADEYEERVMLAFHTKSPENKKDIRPTTEKRFEWTCVDINAQTRNTDN